MNNKFVIVLIIVKTISFNCFSMNNFGFPKNKFRMYSNAINKRTGLFLNNKFKRNKLDKSFEINGYLPKLKYDYNKYSNISVGLSLIECYSDDIVSIPLAYHGPFIESGIAFDKYNNYMCNKIGYEAFLILGCRFNLIQYTDFKQSNFFFRPEIGFSLFSYLTLTYGYDIKVVQNSSNLKNGNVLSLNFAYFIAK